MVDDALGGLQWILGLERVDEGIEGKIEVLFEVAEVGIEVVLQALSDSAMLVVIIKFWTLGWMAVGLGESRRVGQWQVQDRG